MQRQEAEVAGLCLGVVSGHHLTRVLLSAPSPTGTYALGRQGVLSLVLSYIHSIQNVPGPKQTHECCSFLKERINK